MPTVLLLLAALAALACSASGVNYLNDELLWTKQGWEQHKLSFPWAQYKQREAEVARFLEDPELAGFRWSSLNGPQGAIQHLIDEDVERGPELLEHSFDLHLLEGLSEETKEAASGVAACKVCLAVTHALWEAALEAADAAPAAAAPTLDATHDLALQLCEYEVPVAVLKEWVLLHAKVQPPQQALRSTRRGKDAKEAAPQEFFLFSQRRSQHAQPDEIDVVRRACRSLVQGWHEKGAGGLQVLGEQLKRYRAAVAEMAGDQQEAPAGKPLELPAQRQCYNKHPQCAKWASKGECEANPGYMVGEEGTGWCRPACGACVPPAPPAPYWQGKLGEEEVESLRDEGYATLKTEACSRAPPCSWAAGAGMLRLLEELAAGGGASAPALVGLASPPEPQANPARLAQSKVMASRPNANPLVKLSPDPKPLSIKGGELSGEAAKAAWDRLQNTCYYINAGWWHYELCYMSRLVQFHTGADQAVEWAIPLGEYSSSDWSVRHKANASLYIEGEQVAYVSQLYDNGGECDLDKVDADAGRGPPPGAERRIVPRSAELQLMCSPDSELRMVVLEPATCQYLVELYVPELCKLESLQAAGGEAAKQEGAGGAALRDEL